MPTINAAEAPATAPKLFPRIGKAWVNKSKKGQDIINCVFGVQKNGANTFESVTLNNGDKLMLVPNTKRPNKKDADFQICLVS